MLKDCIQNIISSIEKKDLVVFCGAGISKNSGLPLANELKINILTTLRVEDEDVEKIMNSNYPFEAFIEVVEQYTDISKILEVFASGVPNTNHVLIAKLAKYGYLKTIFTTNFDLLIENAFQLEGLKRNKDFEVYYDEIQFSKLDFENIDNKIVKIFKIHGSLENRKSLRTTLKAVASKRLSYKRINLLRYLFSTGNHKKVLILGYSCSDIFDITPQIQSVHEKNKEIILVEHSELGESIEDIKLAEYNNPFKKYFGKRLTCNTAKFMEKICCLREGIVTGDYDIVNFESKWDKKVDEWFKELKDNKEFLRYFIVAGIFFDTSDTKLAIDYFKKSLNVSKEKGIKIGISASCSSLGETYSLLGDYKKAIDYFKESLQIAKKIENKSEELLCNSCYVGLGNIYSELGDFNQAIEYYKKSLEFSYGLEFLNRGMRKLGFHLQSVEVVANVSRKEDNWLDELPCYAQLAGAYARSGDLKNAIKYYGMAIEIAENIGDKLVEAGSYRGLGLVYHSLENFDSAINYSWKALTISEEVGNKVETSICYTNIGAIYDSLGDSTKAIQYHKKSLEIADEIGNKSVQSTCYLNLGCFYNYTGDWNRAIEYHKKSLETADGIGDKVVQSKCYGNLGVSYRNLGDDKNAIMYYEKALGLADDIGDKVTQLKCHEVLGNYYSSLENYEIAKKYYNEGIEIANEIGNKKAELRCSTNIGDVYEKLNDTNSSIKYNMKSLHVAKDIGDKEKELKYCDSLGSSYHNLKDYNNAIKYYEKAIGITIEIGDKLNESVCYVGLGNSFHGLSNFKNAIKYYEKALEITNELKNDKKDSEIACYKNLASCYYYIRDFNKVIEYCKKLLEVAKKTENKNYELGSYESLGKSYIEIRDYKNAIKYYEKAIRIAKQIGNKDIEAGCYIGLGICYVNLSKFKKALDCFLNTDKIFNETGQVSGISLRDHYDNLYLAYKITGDKKNAGKYEKLKNSIK